MRRFVDDYNLEVDRHKRDDKAAFSKHLKWSSRLKECLARGQYAFFDVTKLRRSLYRPFTAKVVFVDKILNQRTGQWTLLSGMVIAVPGPGNRKEFGTLVSDTILPLDLAFEKIQCFPLAHLKDAAIDQFRDFYFDTLIGKTDIFHYIYAILHHPKYRERYADNLKRELPRIPFAPDFHAFASAGQKLASLHVGYESLKPWSLASIEQKGVPFSERVVKMKLSKDRSSIQINESLTLTGIPPEAFQYKLGSKSALEWVIDQYQVKGDSDPNRADDPGYIVRLVGQVIRVSVETVQLVNSLPDFQPTVQP